MSNSVIALTSCCFCAYIIHAPYIFSLSLSLIYIYIYIYRETHVQKRCCPKNVVTWTNRSIYLSYWRVYPIQHKKFYRPYFPAYKMHIKIILYQISYSIPFIGIITRGPTTEVWNQQLCCFEWILQARKYGFCQNYFKKKKEFHVFISFEENISCLKFLQTFRKYLVITYIFPYKDNHKILY